jgi:hypothetical protein
MAQTRKAQPYGEIKQALERVAAANDADMLSLDALYLISDRFDSDETTEEFWDIMDKLGISIDAVAEVA